jgi:hypothetical protein
MKQAQFEKDGYVAARLLFDRRQSIERFFFSACIVESLGPQQGYAWSRALNAG